MWVFPGFFAVCGLVGPCLSDLLTTNAHTSERNLFGQVRFSELEWWHLGAAVTSKKSAGSEAAFCPILLVIPREC